MSIDFEGINASLLARSREFLFELFPAGRVKGREFAIGNIQGDAGSSLKINLDTGKGGDFAGPERFGDLIDVYAAYRGLTVGEAAKELSGEHGRSNGAGRPAPPPQPAPRDDVLDTPPVNEPMPSFHHFEHGTPSKVYVYTESHVVARYETDAGKQILPWSYLKGKWQMKAHPKPRPLYNVDGIVPGDRIIVVEGEKCVEHLKRMGIGRRPVCWPGGAKAVKHADWSALTGCDVLLCPDHDQAGREAMAEVAGQLLKHGATVSIIETAALDLAPGWDVADANWTREEFNAWARPLVVAVEATPAKANGQHTPPAQRGAPRTTASGQPPNGILHAGENAFVSWGALGLECDSKGQPHAHIANFIKIIRTHPMMKGHIWLDEFHSRVYQTVLQPEPVELSDILDLKLTEWLQSGMRIAKAHKHTVRDAINVVAADNVRNEPMDWLNGIVWDGVERLPLMFVDGWGAEDTPYARSIAVSFMVGMVARLYQPGCQVDYLPVFEGGQGIGKSKALRILGGKWYAENHEEIGSKDFFQNLPGKMLVEFAEMHTLSARDVKRVKGILSSPVDRYRESYAHRSTDHPRRCVFGATTNNRDWNEDDTGARRFWPVPCDDINADYITANRDQLFAEALHRYRAGHAWWEFDTSAAAVAQDERRIPDPWEESIASYLALLPKTAKLHINDILQKVLDISPADCDMRAAKRVATILRSLEWERKSVRAGTKVEKFWVCKRPQKNADTSSADKF